MLYDERYINKISSFQYFFIYILGTLLQFTFQLSKNNKLVGAFSTINESTWEHLKLVFFPSILTIIIGYFYIGKDLPNFICSKTIGMLSLIAFIVVFFYTYSGILGKNISIIDISSFYIAVALGEYISYKLIINNFQCNNALSLIVLFVLFITFIYFTFPPPKIGLFKDPLTGTYEIYNKR